MKKSLISIIICIFFFIRLVRAQEDVVTEPAKATNIFSIGMQPTLFRLNFYDPNFFNNPEFKPGVDITFHYGKNLLNSWYLKSGIDLVYTSGKFLTGIDLVKKYVNESTVRIPLFFVKKFTIDCNDCFMNPAFFVEGGGYYSTSIFQSVYVQDEPTGLSTLDTLKNFGYQKAGFFGGMGISFLSNNFGRHVIGVRIYSDQWISEDYDQDYFRPSYSSISLFYNIANFNW